MGTALLVVAAVLFAGSIVVLVVVLRRPRQTGQPAGRQDPLAFSAAAQCGPRQLGPGAVVSYGGVDYVVRGSVTFREGPFVWWEHLLEGGGQPVWFSVEDDDGRLELATWVTRKDLGLLEPGGEHHVDGVTLAESEHGRAGYTTEGTTGLPPGGVMEFVDYTHADQDRAAVLRALGTWHALGGVDGQVGVGRRAHCLPGPTGGPAL